MRKKIAIIGGGPSAMMLAAHLDTDKYEVSLYEKNHHLGKKFLVAGKGGFNLTHSEEVEVFAGRYHPNYFLKKAVTNFSNTDLREWMREIGIETYTGTSKRVFPVKGIKPVDVLDAIVEEINQNHVRIITGMKWLGFATDNSLIFESKYGIENVKPDFAIFALGGASWKITGSDGSWLPHFMEKGINCNPFEPSNCALKTEWPEAVINKLEGAALKNCKFKCGQSFQLGEAVITAFGIEGSGIYPLSQEVRWQLSNLNKAQLYIDLKPQNTIGELEEKLKERKNISITGFLERELNLGEVKTLLLKSIISKDDFVDSSLLSERIKNLPVVITGLAPLDEAISTVGGIDLKEVDEHYQLKKFPNHFVIGEMLDWDAPTGGYLLQACFSMGNQLAHHLNKI